MTVATAFFHMAPLSISRPKAAKTSSGGTSSMRFSTTVIVSSCQIASTNSVEIVRRAKPAPLLSWFR